MHIGYLGHMVASGIVHGLIYATIFKISHLLGLPGMLALTVLGIGLVWLFTRRR